MRVLFVALHLGPDGVNSHMRTLGRALVARGWEVGLATRGRQHDHPFGPDAFEAAGMPHFTVPFPRWGSLTSSLVQVLPARAALRRVVDRFAPDLLHVHWRALTPLAGRVARAGGPPYVTTLHAAPVPHGPLHRLFSSWSDYTIAVSTEAAAFLTKAFNLPPSRIRVVFNGADEQVFRTPTPAERAAARRSLGVGEAPFVLCHLGRLAPDKGHDLLVRAVARLRAAGLDVPALLAGTGPLETSICTLAKTCGVADLIRPTGYTDARDVLWASDVLVLPSRREGFGLVVAEAMLCGVVPVRTPGGGASDQIEHGSNGFIVPFEDVDALAARIAELYRDGPGRARMAHAARATGLEKFTARAMAEATEAVYEEVLQRANRRPDRSAQRLPAK